MRAGDPLHSANRGVEAPESASTSTELRGDARWYGASFDPALDWAPNVAVLNRLGTCIVEDLAMTNPVSKSGRSGLQRDSYRQARSYPRLTWLVPTQ